MSIPRYLPIALLTASITACANRPTSDRHGDVLDKVDSEIVHMDGDRFNRLHIGVIPSIPADRRTVAAALRWLLEPTGYTLVSDSYLTKRPLPTRPNESTMLMVETAILQTIGDESAIVIDHDARKLKVVRLPTAAKVTHRVTTGHVD